MLTCEHAGFHETVLRMFALRKLAQKNKKKHMDLTNNKSMTERE
jgi:hypothetical protein